MITLSNVLLQLTSMMISHDQPSTKKEKKKSKQTNTTKLALISTYPTITNY